MAETVSEKVIRLETQMTDTKIQLNRVEAKVDTLITKLDDFTVLNTEIKGLKEDIINLKKHRVLFGWLFPTLAATAGAILAILVGIAVRK